MNNNGLCVCLQTTGLRSTRQSFVQLHDHSVRQRNTVAPWISERQSQRHECQRRRSSLHTTSRTRSCHLPGHRGYEQDLTQYHLKVKYVSESLKNTFLSVRTPLSRPWYTQFKLMIQMAMTSRLLSLVSDSATSCNQSCATQSYKRHCHKFALSTLLRTNMHQTLTGDSSHWMQSTVLNVAITVNATVRCQTDPRTDQKRSP